MMNAKLKFLATLVAALTLASGLAFGGFHYKQVWSPGYETVSWSVPAGAYVLWESATWGGTATLEASGAGVSVSSYVGPHDYDYGDQYTNASGTINATLIATGYSGWAMTLISVYW